MITTANTFIEHIQSILEVARRLQPRGITLFGHDCNFCHFGNWSVVAGIEHERFQFSWEGRTFTFTIAKGVLVSGRRDWEQIRTLNLQYPEAVSGMETFLYETFSA